MTQRLGKKRFTDDIEVSGNVVSDGLFVSSVEIDPSGASVNETLAFDGSKFSPVDTSVVALSSILIDSDFTFPSNKNGVSVSPVSVDDQVTVTVPNGATWLIVPQDTPIVSVSDTAPVLASKGDLWFDSSDGKFFIYYDNFWVEVGG